MTPARPTRRAFTLLELIVVLAISGLLAALAIPTFARAVERSEHEQALTTLAAIARDAGALAASTAARSPAPTWPPRQARPPPSPRR